MAKTTLGKPEPTDALDVDHIRSLDTAALRAELATALGLTARHLLYLAAVWAELEARGEDLSDLRSGLGTWLPLIAAGQVLPEVYVAFSGRETVLRAVAALPIPEQRRLAVERQSVPLVVRQGDQYTHRMLPAHALTATQARLVFGNRTIRSETEQIALLTAVLPRPNKTGRAPKRGRLRADRERGVILLGRRPLDPADMLAALADLKVEQTEEPGDNAATLVVKLTPDEHRRLKVAAANGDTTLVTLARNALRVAGLI